MSIADKISDSLDGASPKNINIIIGVVMMVILAAFYFVGIGPQLNVLTTVVPQIKILTDDLAKARIDIQRNTLYQNQSKELEEKLLLINQRVKTREEVPMIMEGISRSANEHDVHIIQMMPLVSSQVLLLSNNDGDYYALPILIEANSGYHDFGRFLKNQEKENEAVTVDRFTVTGRESDRMKHSIRLTVKTIIFESKSENVDAK